MPFELTVEPLTLLILALVAFVAGFIDAIAGGGGLLTTPALLTAGMPPHLVLGTNKLSSTFGSATASFTYYKRKLFHPAQWRPALFATLVGALIGAIVAHYMPAEWLNKMLPVIVFACGLYLLFGGTPKAPLDADAPIRKKWQAPQGFTLGFYDGVAGPGTGAFWTVSSLLLFLTPIFYPVSMVPESMRWMIDLNPLAWATEAARNVLLSGTVAPWDGWGLHLAVSCVFATMGWAFFQRTKPGFADVL